MKRKYRLLTYSVLIAFAMLSQLLWMEGPIWEPLLFIGLIVLLGGIYEIYSWKAGKK